MNYPDLIRLYFERTTAFNSLWTLYVVVLGGLLAFSSLRKTPDRLTTALVSLLFIVFSYQNLGALRDTTAQREAAVTLIGQTHPVSYPYTLDGTIHPVTYGNVLGFHLLSDVLTLAALWSMELRRRRAANAALAAAPMI